MTCSALRNPSHFSQNACSDFHYNLHCLAYDLHAESLEAVFPFLAVLPERELDLSKIVDRLLTDPHARGSGLHHGRSIYGDSSQAVNRKPWAFGNLTCILPGSKFIDFENQRILGSSHVLRLQGVLPSLDFAISYEVASERTGADMAGNAMSGHCLANVFITILSTSKVPPCVRMRVTGKRRRQPSFEEVPHEEDSGLGVLFKM